MVTAPSGGLDPGVGGEPFEVASVELVEGVLAGVVETPRTQSITQRFRWKSSETLLTAGSAVNAPRRRDRRAG